MAKKNKGIHAYIGLTKLEIQQIRKVWQMIQRGEIVDEDTAKATRKILTKTETQRVQEAKRIRTEAKTVAERRIATKKAKRIQRAKQAKVINQVKQVQQVKQEPVAEVKYPLIKSHRSFYGYFGAHHWDLTEEEIKERLLYRFSGHFRNWNDKYADELYEAFISLSGSAFFDTCLMLGLKSATYDSDSQYVINQDESELYGLYVTFRRRAGLNYMTEEEMSKED